MSDRGRGAAADTGTQQAGDRPAVLHPRPSAPRRAATGAAGAATPGGGPGRVWAPPGPGGGAPGAAGLRGTRQCPRERAELRAERDRVPLPNGVGKAGVQGEGLGDSLSATVSASAAICRALPGVWWHTPTFGEEPEL